MNFKRRFISTEKFEEPNEETPSVRILYVRMLTSEGDEEIRRLSVKSYMFLENWINKPLRQNNHRE